MILSSADILKILGGSEIIRLSAKLKIVDGKPALSGAEGLFVYIDRFPKTDEFQATWTIYIESDGSEPDDLVLAEIQKLLPSVKITPGLLTTVTTTDFLSGNTQRAPEAPKPVQAKVDLAQYEERFQALVEDVQDQMLLVTSGRAGKDGRDGQDGVDGRDGRDLVATDANLEDLANVEDGIAKERGQVLTWDGEKWTNLFVPQVYSAGGATGGGGTATPSDAVSATVQWKFDNAQLTDQLSDGTFHTDSLEGELVTKIRVSHLTGRNNDITVLIGDLLTQGYDRLYIAQSDDLSQAQLYLITGFAPVTDGTELTVTHLVTAGIEPNFLNNKNYEFYISQSAGAGGGSIISVNGKTGIVVLDAADVGAATVAQGALADTALQPGDNISDLTNDAGYITAAQVPESGISEAPLDGNYYVRSSGAWVNLTDALSTLGVEFTDPVDAGNFTTGLGTAINNQIYDAGNFTDGTSAATGSDTIDGGLTTL